jgi:predicted secreted hydrolase
MSVFALLLAAGASIYAVARILQPEPLPTSTASTVDWAATLAGLPDEGFERPSGAWRLDLPADHGAHPNTRTETWTISAHLRNDHGDDMGMQFVLFRVGLVPPNAPPFESAWTPRELYRGHVTLVGGTDERAGGEERFNRAVLGVAGHDAARRQVWLDNWSIDYGQGARGDELRLSATVDTIAVELLFTPAKLAVASDPDGGGAPFRGFSITRMSVQGFIGDQGDRQPVSGLAWLDHLWGDVPLPLGPIAWDRLQLQLDDGSDVAVLRARRRDGGGSATVDGYVVDPGGGVVPLASRSLEMEATRTWRRSRGGVAYPLDWQLSAGELRLRVSPLVDDQLHDFVVPFWSGLVTAQGELRGRAVSGLGTLQLTGYTDR